MRLCPDCRSQVNEHAVFCDNCGYPIQAENGGESSSAPSMPSPGVPIAGDAAPGTCSACGFVNVPGETFCQNCGVQLAPVTSAPPPLPVPLPAQEEIKAAAPISGQASGICSNCGYSLGPGELFCQSCGMQVGSSPVSAPVAFPYAVPAPAAPANQAGFPPAYNAPQEYYPPAPPSPGYLIVRATNVSIPLPVGKSEIILGRTDPARGVYPDVDLTSHGGDTSGVSRQHARLIVQGYQVYLEDLNATNFTFLNRLKLQPGQRYLLTPGDELRLGLLVLQFQAS